MIHIPQQNLNVRIVEFILIQTGSYQEQYLRPITVNTDFRVAKALEETTEGGRNLDITTLEDVASSVFVGRTQTEGNSQIANGWRSRRFSFLMRVIEEPKFQTGSQNERIFFGYTDHCDESGRGLSSDMRIYFNSELTISTTVTPNAAGVPTPRSRVMSSTQIVSPQDLMGSQGQLIHLLRPEDIFYHSFDQGIAQEFTRNGFVPGKIQSISDQRSTSTYGGRTGTFKLNNRNDNSPSRFLQRAMRGYAHGIKESRELDSEMIDESVILSNAGGYTKNPEMHQITFFNILKEDCGYLEQGFVRYGDLCSVFPQLDQTAGYAMDDGRSLRRLSTIDDSENWNGGEEHHIAPSMLAQIVPSIMMENYIRQIDFTVNPGNGVGQYFIDIDYQRTRMISDNLPDEVVNQSINEFRRRLELDVLNYITHRNQVYCQIAMNTNLMSESVINIAFDSQPITPYVAPTFSDGLFNHLATHNLSTQQQVCSDMNWLMKESFSNMLMPDTSAYSMPTKHYNAPTIGRGTPSPIQQAGGAFSDLGDLTNNII